MTSEVLFEIVKEYKNIRFHYSWEFGDRSKNTKRKTNTSALICRLLAAILIRKSLEPKG